MKALRFKKMTVDQAGRGGAISLHGAENPYKPRDGGGPGAGPERGGGADWKQYSHRTVMPAHTPNIDSLPLLKIWYFVYHRFKKNYCIQVPCKSYAWGEHLAAVWSWPCGHDKGSRVFTEHLLADKPSQVRTRASSSSWPCRWERCSPEAILKSPRQDSVTLSLPHSRRILWVPGCWHGTI